MTQSQWGFDSQSFQPPVFPTAKQKYQGIKGRSEFAAFSSPPSAILRIQTFEPLSVHINRKKYIGIRGKSEFAVFKVLPMITVTISGTVTDSIGGTVSYSVKATNF